MKIDKSLLSGSHAMLVLSLLSEREKYGYQIITELALRSDDTFQMKEGTLYPILHALEKDKCIEGFEQTAPTGRVRRYYRITPKGLALLDEKQAMWAAFTEKVEAVMHPKAMEQM